MIQNKKNSFNNYFYWEGGKLLCYLHRNKGRDDASFRSSLSISQMTSNDNKFKSQKDQPIIIFSVILENGSGKWELNGSTQNKVVRCYLRLQLWRPKSKTFQVLLAPQEIFLLSSFKTQICTKIPSHEKHFFCLKFPWSINVEALVCKWSN